MLSDLIGGCTTLSTQSKTCPATTLLFAASARISLLQQEDLYFGGRVDVLLWWGETFVVRCGGDVFYVHIHSFSYLHTFVAPPSLV